LKSERSSERERPAQRSDYAVIRTVTTRWMDNDMYGHVNNVVYYSYFDTAVNAWLIEADLLAPADSSRGISEVIGLVVETQCRYFAPISFPDSVAIGMRVARLGTSSVRYELAVFRNDETSAAAQGHFVHVYVDRETRRPTPLPPVMRQWLEERQASVSLTI
jgi:acyl-CoA thioester hydrolase